MTFFNEFKIILVGKKYIFNEYFVLYLKKVNFLTWLRHYS